MIRKVVYVLLTKAFRFDVKAIEAKPGQFSGRASVYGVVDAVGDVVMPGAFTKSLEDLGNRVKVLNQHNPMDPVGIASLTDSDTALLAEGDLVLDLPSAKDAYTRLTHGLIDSLSIGYEVLKDGYDKGVRLLHEIKLWEISLVTFPANQYARITDVKAALAAVQDERIVREAIEILPYAKAGRSLSATNRSKLSTFLQTLREEAEKLQALLDETDPDKEKNTNAAEVAALNTLLTNLRTLRA